MKTFLSLLLLLSFGAQARIVKPVIDGDLSHRYDDKFGSTQRGIAGDKPVPAQDVEKEQSEVEWEDTSRDPSAAGDVMEKESDTGIKYWKY